MKRSVNVGFSFGLTSGVITTLGLIVGLDSSTHSKAVVLGGILTIAIADAFSDALGIHISEESIGVKVKDIWRATGATWLAKFFFALTFVIPFLFLDLTYAVYACIAYGFMLIALFSHYIAKKTKTSSREVISEHLLIAFIVIILTHVAGDYIGKYFG